MNISERQVLSTAPIMGEDGPEGVLLETDTGWIVLRGRAAVNLLANPGTPLKRARRKGAETPADPAPVEGEAPARRGRVAKSHMPHVCMLCPPEKRKPISRRYNALKHVRDVHGRKNADKHIRPVK